MSLLDPLEASTRAISRGLDRYLTPDESGPYCETCQSEDCICFPCALCGGSHECRYDDCGEAEEAHLEDGREYDREGRCDSK